MVHERYALQEVTPPAVEPVGLAAAKLHLRVDGTADDVLITAMAIAAREQCETFTNLSLITTAWRMSLAEFPCDGVIVAPRAPLIAVTAVKYRDTEGDEQTLDPSAYQVDARATPGRIVPAHGTRWPATRCQPNAVTVEFTAGFGADADDVPFVLTAGIKLYLGHLYQHRGDAMSDVMLPDAIKSLWWPRRVFL